jgi:hypothetical protein
MGRDASHLRLVDGPIHDCGGQLSSIPHYLTLSTSEIFQQLHQLVFSQLLKRLSQLSIHIKCELLQIFRKYFSN